MCWNASWPIPSGICQLSLLPDDERREVLAWSHELCGVAEELHIPAPLAPQGIHGRFESQVRATPNEVALIADDERLSYAELDGANRLARRFAFWVPALRFGLALSSMIP